ncbi:MAG: hypothetical protein NT062_08520, partial [Proteobacteria bacterium]|nr:hypothetical protein [Pseudomonadota bacterium]
MMGTQFQQSADPQVAKMIATATTVVRTSCLEDGWSDALRQCVIKLDVSGQQSDAMRACEGLMPPGLEQKMTQRMSAAMAQP